MDTSPGHVMTYKPKSFYEFLFIERKREKEREDVHVYLYHSIDIHSLFLSVSLFIIDSIKYIRFEIETSPGHFMTYKPKSFYEFLFIERNREKMYMYIYITPLTYTIHSYANYVI